MKAKNINSVARTLNANESTLESRLNGFVAMWCKLSKKDVTDRVKALTESLKADSDNESLKAERYRLESAIARSKSLAVTAVDLATLEELRNEGVTFGMFTRSYIVSALEGTHYCDNGTLCDKVAVRDENGKKIGDEFKVVEKWTNLKVARFIRLAQVTNEMA